MCIPDEYFLDGEYDCADLTDEKEPFDDTICTLQPASYECDDRMCLRYHEEIIEYNRTNSEECLYFVKCALSVGEEKNCPCKRNVSCINELDNPCSLSMIQYPNGAIIAPYIFSFYNAVRDWSELIPDSLIINGTLKCRGYMVYQYTIVEYPYRLSLQQLETTLCASKSNISILSNTGYDEFCHNDSRTFKNHSYNFIDICNKSKECISAYRIKDGYRGCAYFEDETISSQFPNICSNIQHHRFRCSSKEPSCLFVKNLGDEITNCRNDRDEWWMNEGIKWSKLICNSQSKDDCGRIRQYIESSWNLDTNNSSDSSPCPAKCDDNHVQCFGYNQTSNCSEYSDFMCLDGQCAKEGWCNQIFDCSHGEDELFCFNRAGSTYISLIGRYRYEKEWSVRKTKQKLQLSQLSIVIHKNTMADKTMSMIHSETPTTNFSNKG
jgi:hypothetical protein